MRKFYLLSILFFSIQWVSAQKKSMTVYEGLLTDSSYVNDSIGVSFMVPPSWHVWSKAEISQIYKDAKQFLEGKAILDFSSSAVLFIAKESEYGAYLQINDSFIFSMNGEYQSYMTIKDEKAYLEYLKQTYNTLLAGKLDKPIQYSSIRDTLLNNVSFKTMGMKIDLGDGKYMVEKHYIKKVNHFFYDFNEKYGSGEDNSLIESMVQSIKIY